MGMSCCLPSAGRPPQPSSNTHPEQGEAGVITAPTLRKCLSLLFVVTVTLTRGLACARCDCPTWQRTHLRVTGRTLRPGELRLVKCLPNQPLLPSALAFLSWVNWPRESSTSPRYL